MFVIITALGKVHLSIHSEYVYTRIHVIPPGDLESQTVSAELFLYLAFFWRRLFELSKRTQTSTQCYPRGC